MEPTAVKQLRDIKREIDETNRKTHKGGIQTDRPMDMQTYRTDTERNDMKCTHTYTHMYR